MICIAIAPKFHTFSGLERFKLIWRERLSSWPGNIDGSGLGTADQLTALAVCNYLPPLPPRIFLAQISFGQSNIARPENSFDFHLILWTIRQWYSATVAQGRSDQMAKVFLASWYFRNYYNSWVVKCVVMKWRNCNFQIWVGMTGGEGGQDDWGTYSWFVAQNWPVAPPVFAGSFYDRNYLSLGESLY